MCRKWIIRDGIVTVQGDKENLTCLEKICRLDGKMRKYYEMIQQALDEFTKNLIVDDYEKGHDYNEGDYCLYDDTLWLCIESHTASDFDPTKWQKVTITDVLKILADNLKTTIQTCGILTESLTTTILTVNSLVGTVGNQGGSITSLDGRVTALENAPAADSKIVIYDATLTNVGMTNEWTLTLSNSKTFNDIYSDIITNKKEVIIDAVGGVNQHFRFTVGEISETSNTQFYIQLNCIYTVSSASMTLYTTQGPNTISLTGSSTSVYSETVNFV